MAKKTKLSHQTADGKVHTRTTARTYSHVIVATNKVSGETSCPSWVGRPDLVAGALAQHKGWPTEWTFHAEPINNGSRTEFSL